MASLPHYFAKLNPDNIVIQVIVVGEEDLIDTKAWWDPIGLFTGKKGFEQVGVSFCQNHTSDPFSTWKKVEYSSRGEGFRCNYPSVGYNYLEGVKTLGVASTDIFIDPQPFPSWSIGINTAHWYPPHERPELTQFEGEKFMEYCWDEERYNLNSDNGWVLLSRKEADLYWDKRCEETRLRNMLLRPKYHFS